MLRILIAILIIFCSSMTWAEETPVFVHGYYDDFGQYHSGYYVIPNQSPTLVNIPFFPIQKMPGYYRPTGDRSTTNNVGGHIPSSMPNTTVGQRSF